MAGPGVPDVRHRGSHAAPAGRQDGGDPSIGGGPSRAVSVGCPWYPRQARHHARRRRTVSLSSSPATVDESDRLHALRLHLVERSDAPRLPAQVAVELVEAGAPVTHVRLELTPVRPGRSRARSASTGPRGGRARRRRARAGAGTSLRGRAPPARPARPGGAAPARRSPRPADSIGRSSSSTSPRRGRQQLGPDDVVRHPVRMPDQRLNRASRGCASRPCGRRPLAQARTRFPASSSSEGSAFMDVGPSGCTRARPPGRPMGRAGAVDALQGGKITAP